MARDKIKHSRSKLISNYGGVGSLIETQDCSIIIETFDNWQYNQLQNRLSAYIIRDDRLLQRLKNKFPNIKHIVQIPTEKNTYTDQIRPTANYFPKWFYCPNPKCQRFADYDEWKKRWIAAGKNIKYFNPPKCSNSECNEQELEQIRFVRTCKNGHIHDIPWRHWNTFLPTDQTTVEDYEGEEGETQNKERIQGPQIDLSKTCCDQQDLRYAISRENTELSGIWVICKNCDNKRNLKGIFNYEGPCFGKKYWHGMVNGNFPDEVCKEITTVKVKTSNSIYYANTLSSIYIESPEMQNPLSNEIRLEIDNMLHNGSFNKEQIAEVISVQKNIPIDVIKNYLDTGNPTFIPDNVFRETEYNYLLEGEQPENKQLKFRVLDCSSEIFGFNKLVKIDKLKKITVQTSFTRQEPIDIDSILQEDNSYEYNVKRQSVSKNNFETRMLPGIESYGEGILFVLDEQKLREWENQQAVKDRTEKIKSHAEASSWQFHQIIARNLIPRKILIHTLSHLLMRELEYVCGYPTSSLQERLYISDNMYGFLISAFDGTDGYLGGLANLCNDLYSLNRIIQSAISRATDCPSDPICMESEGQGVAQLNLAACHACSITPETTCELSNLFLDRKLLINTSFGYFKENVEEQVNPTHLQTHSSATHS
ncbi:MAG: DrmB family protein [bacterium]